MFKCYADKYVWEISGEDVKYQVIRYGTPEGCGIDIIFFIGCPRGTDATMLGTFADYNTVEKRKYIKALELQGVPVKILSPEGLIFLKSGTLREIDHYDVKMLQTLIEYRQQEPEEPMR